MAGKISDLSAIGAIDRAADFLEVVDTSANTSNKVTPNNMLGITGNPIGTTDSQTLTNKVIGITNTITQTDNVFIIQGNADTTKKIKFDAGSITTGNTRTYTMPDATTTLVGTGTTQTLTNKTLTSPTLTSPTLTNASITQDAVTGFTTSNTGTVYGIAVTTGVVSTSNVIPNNSHVNSGTWGSSWAWAAWSPTWTNLTVGNGTVTAKYTQIGKTVTARISVVFGTTTTVTGDIKFTFPVTAASYAGTGNVTIIGTVNLFDTSAARVFIGGVQLESTTLGTFRQWAADTTYLYNQVASSTNPFTWATGDEIGTTFTYEAA